MDPLQELIEVFLDDPMQEVGTPQRSIVVAMLHGLG
jgi:hypothetical protein